MESGLTLHGKFEDNIGVIRSRKSKRDKQNNEQKGQENKQLSTIHYTKKTNLDIEQH
jgi:hypothetical protein